MGMIGHCPEAIGNEEAVQRAAKHGAAIKFDRLAMSPYYNYTEAGTKHVVWFEDARSVLAKYLITKGKSVYLKLENSRYENTCYFLPKIEFNHLQAINKSIYYGN